MQGTQVGQLTINNMRHTTNSQCGGGQETYHCVQDQVAYCNRVDKEKCATIEQSNGDDDADQLDSYYTTLSNPCDSREHILSFVV